MEQSWCCDLQNSVKWIVLEIMFCFDHCYFEENR
jgi:hypothetical protein